MQRATSNRITFIAPKPSSVSFRAQSERLIAEGVRMTLVYRKLIFRHPAFPSVGQHHLPQCRAIRSGQNSELPVASF